MCPLGLAKQHFGEERENLLSITTNTAHGYNCTLRCKLFIGLISFWLESIGISQWTITVSSNLFEFRICLQLNLWTQSISIRYKFYSTVNCPPSPKNFFFFFNSGVFLYFINMNPVITVSYLGSECTENPIFSY